MKDKIIVDRSETLHWVKLRIANLDAVTASGDVEAARQAFFTVEGVIYTLYHLGVIDITEFNAFDRDLFDNHYYLAEKA